jgi:hypothetical protein
LEAHSVERKLAAMFATDVEGYGDLMERDEVGTLRTLCVHQIQMSPSLPFTNATLDGGRGRAAGGRGAPAWRSARPATD